MIRPYLLLSNGSVTDDVFANWVATFDEIEQAVVFISACNVIDNEFYMPGAKTKIPGYKLTLVDLRMVDPNDRIILTVDRSTSRLLNVVSSYYAELQLIQARAVPVNQEYDLEGPTFDPLKRRYTATFRYRRSQHVSFTGVGKLPMYAVNDALNHIKQHEDYLSGYTTKYGKNSSQSGPEPGNQKSAGGNKE